MRSENMNEENNFFHPLLCHVCKKGLENGNLKKCAQCNMIQYCSVQHQKQHWLRHQSVCRCIKSVKTKLKINSRKDWEMFKLLCIARLGRLLVKEELGMFQFPLICQFCASNSDLSICDSCHSFYRCKKHFHGFDSHDCKNTRLRLDIDLYLWQFDMPVAFIRDKITPDFVDIKSFVLKNLLNEDINKPPAVALLSETLSRPLSLLYALSAINYHWQDTLVIHILGGNQFEASTVQYWDIIMDLQPVKNLQLHFIGPEAAPPGPFTEAVTATSCTDLYHKTSLGVPHCVCAFNSGIHEFTGEASSDTWGPSLAKILALKVPVVLTSFNVEEAVLDVNRFREFCPRLRVRQFANPFAGLTPIWDPENLAVAFSNQILSVLVPENADGVVS